MAWLLTHYDPSIWSYLIILVIVLILSRYIY